MAKLIWHYILKQQQLKLYIILIAAVLKNKHIFNIYNKHIKQYIYIFTLYETERGKKINTSKLKTHELTFHTIICLFA